MAETVRLHPLHMAGDFCVDAVASTAVPVDVPLCEPAALEEIIRIWASSGDHFPGRMKPDSTDHESYN